MKQWELRARFELGIAVVPTGMFPAFVTLTFPLDRAPEVEEAHECLRALVRRLKYRKLLGDYGWVLQRQANGTLHYHGIFHMTPMDDRLSRWRESIVASGFGPINRIEIARPDHARYCSKYIASRLAELGPKRRAFGFSQNFPRPEEERNAEDESDAAAATSACNWSAVPF